MKATIPAAMRNRASQALLASIAGIKNCARWVINKSEFIDGLK
jgi:hypothetical protein